MNFLCGKCKQKYHVADEKVRGRDLVRFKCKKCENIIEVHPATDALPDDTSTSTEIAQSQPPPPAGIAASPKIAPAPRAPTGTGLPTRPATAARLPTAPASAPRSVGAPVASPARSAAGAGLPTRPATGTGLTAARPPSPFAPSAPRPATQSRLPTAPARAASPLSPRPQTGTRLPAAGAGASPLRSALAQQPASPEPRPAQSASALRNDTETGWYAGIRDLPVGPLTRSEVSAKIESGDITPDTLVWREGLDDWRAIRVVDELADLVREAAKKISGGLLDDMGKREAPATARNVVSIARGAPEKREERPEFGEGEDDEPTRMTSMAELLGAAQKTAPKSPSAKEPARAEPKRESKPPVAPAPRATAAPSAANAPEPAHAAPKRESKRPAAAVPAASAAAAAEPVASVVAPVARVSPAALAGPGDPTVHMDPAAVQPLARAKSEHPPARKAGVPMGVWVLMGGVLIIGVAIGMFMRSGSNQQSATTGRPTTRQTPTPPAAVARTVGAEIRLGTDNPPAAPPSAPEVPAPSAPAATTQPEGPAAVANGSSTHSSRSGSARTASAAAGGTGRTLTAEQQAMLNAALGGSGGGGVAASAPSTAALRPGGGGASSGGSEPAGLTGSARAEQVLETFNRSRVVNDCWNTALRRNPAHPREAFRVRIDVGATGRASVSVAGANDADLARCIQQRAGARPFGAGGTIIAEQSISLAPGGD